LPDDIEVACDAVPEPCELHQARPEDQDLIITLSESDPTQPNEAGHVFIYRTWTSIDCAGNEATHTQTITVKDETAPVFTRRPLEEETVDCDCEHFDPPQLKAFDNCDDEVEFTSTEEKIFATSSDENNLLYKLVREWTATDTSGNKATATSTLFVVDDVAPEYVSNMDDTQLNCIFEVPEPVDTPIILDACDPNPIVSCEIATTLDGDCHSEHERTCMAIDATGNANPVTQVITVKDVTAPSLQNTEFCIQEQHGMMATFDFNDLILQRFNPHDNCGGDVVIKLQTKSDHLTLTPDEQQLIVPLDIHANEYSMTLELTDQCGNVGTETVNLIVRSSSAGSCFVPLSVNTHPVSDDYYYDYMN
jgi:hypothetical protein